MQVGSRKPTCHKYLLLTHEISYNSYQWPRNPERRSSYKLIREGSRDIEGSGCLPLTLPEGQPGNTTQPSVNQMLETTSRFWEVPEARFSPMTYMSKVGKGTVPWNGGEHTAPARLRPPFFASPTVLEVADPPAAFTAAQQGEHFQLCFSRASFPRF